MPGLLLISDRDVPAAAWAKTNITVGANRVGTRGRTLHCNVRGWLLLKISHASLLALAREQSEYLIVAAGLRVRGNGAGVVGEVLAYLTRALLKMSDNSVSPRLDNPVATCNYYRMYSQVQYQGSSKNFAVKINPTLLPFPLLWVARLSPISVITDTSLSSQPSSAPSWIRISHPNASNTCGRNPK